MEKIELFENFLGYPDTDTLMLSLYSNITWYDTLTSIDTNEPVKIRRKMGYVSNVPDYIYKYATLSFPGQTWFHDLSIVRDRLNKFTGRNFNSVLLNLYEDGKDEIRWHSDKEEQLGENPTIACVNLGVTRKFWFFNKETKIKSFYSVKNGDLLMMNEGCQAEYSHAILKEPEVTGARISLTFREVI